MGHFYPRQTVLAPAGLITEPNEYGQYPPGALKLARNVTMREPGKLVQAPSVRNDVVVGGDVITNPVTHHVQVRKLIPAGSGKVYAITALGVSTTGDWAIYEDGTPQTFVGLAGNAFSDTGRISWAECKERIIVNGKFGTLVRDPVPISTDFRSMGLPQPLIVALALGTDSPVWLDVDQAVAYRVCVARRYSGDYTLRSAPSPSVKIHHGVGAKSTVSVTIEWPTGAGLEEGDVLEIYRTNILATTSPAADPGGTFRLVKEHALSSAELAAGGIVLSDTQEPIAGTLATAGRELYTNPGVEGENYANLRPPICQCIVSFKGFAFYGNTTERAQLKVSFPGGMGSIMTSGGATSRARGIGQRTGNGTITAGSAVITGVSAAHMVGVQVGQLWSGSTVSFPLTASVAAVGASTITMDVVATGAGPDWALDDVMLINGIPQKLRIGGSGILQLLNDLNGAMEAQLNQSIPYFGGYMTGFDLTLMWNSHPFDRAISVRATNGQNYSPPLRPFGQPDVTQFDPLVRKNRVCWSKEQQPEHAPSVSETFVGFGEIYAMNATRDAVWIWCSDGLFRLSGNGGSLGLGAWQVDYANATLLLCAPQASTVLEDILYGYCNVGVVGIDSAGNVRDLTAGTIGDILPGPRYREVPNVIMERNETDGEVLLGPAPADEDDIHEDFPRTIYVYNVRQKGWTCLGANSGALDNVTAIAMHRLPPLGAEAHVLFAGYRVGELPIYSSWIGGDAPDVYLWGAVLYQPLYGEDPLELKRWMWVDYLFAAGTPGPIAPMWNGDGTGFGSGNIPVSQFDAGLYARAGVPREVGVSHSLAAGFEWVASSTQRRFEGISLAVKQRTNQPKERGA